MEDLHATAFTFRCGTDAVICSARAFGWYHPERPEHYQRQVGPGCGGNRPSGDWLAGLWRAS